MLLRKDVYLYEYMDEWEKFNERAISEIKKMSYAQRTSNDLVCKKKN